MTVIFVRTVIFYIILSLCMRLMGKRQIGEIQMPEFVAAVMLSEMAALPITDTNIPLMHGLVSVLTLACLEIIISFLCKKSTAIRKALDGTPMLLMAKGNILEKNLGKSRITLDELFSEIRANGYRNASDIEYIILEQTGKISIIPKARFDAITPDDLSKKVEERGISHTLIIDGALQDYALEAAGKDEIWLGKRLEERNLKQKDLLFMTVDDKGKIVIQKKERE